MLRRQRDFGGADAVRDQASLIPRPLPPLTHLPHTNTTHALPTPYPAPTHTPPIPYPPPSHPHPPSPPPS